MEIERMDYIDAVKQLAEQYNIPMDDFQKKWQSSPQYKSEKEKTKRIIKLSQEFFVSQRKQNQAVQNYLIEKRGISEEKTTILGLGYAPSQSSSFLNYLLNKGFKKKDLLDAGMIKQRENSGEYYAFFRNRLIIPIRDQLGNVIAFGARALQAGQEPKYLNSSDSIIYKKTNTLYGIDNIRNGIKQHDSIIIVEGYFDVISLQIANWNIGLATCGTALTEQHISTIKRYTDNVYFLFDNDKAGIKANIRGLGIAYSLSVYPEILSLPKNKNIKDIDDLVRQSNDSKQAVGALLKESKDGFERLLDHFAKGYRDASPVEKERAIQELFRIIQQVESINIQSHFLEKMDEYLNKRQGESEKSYRVFAAQQKTRRRKLLDISIPENAKKTTEQRRIHRLWTLLHDDFWEKLEIDKEWIARLQKFIQISKVQEPVNINYDQIELEREQEINTISEGGGTTATSFIKKNLSQTISLIQKEAMKIANQEEKTKILEMVRKLR